MAGPLCPLDCDLQHRSGESFAGPDGTGKNGVLLLGEALGEAEARTSTPFKGDAGMMLGVVLHNLGYERKDFLIDNPVKCRPPNNWLEGAPWEQSALAHCRPFFEDTLAANPQIKVIVPMGNVPLHYLLKEKGIGMFHGTVHKVPTQVHGTQANYWVVPTFHPSYLMRGNTEEIQTVRFDLEKAVGLAKNPYSYERQPTSYVLQPSETRAWEFYTEYIEALAGDPTLVLASDIETPDSVKLAEDDAEDSPSYNIQRISFAFREGEAITMPWEGPYVRISKRLLEADGMCVFWNGDRFDLPRLRAQGCEVSRSLDAQEGWHFLYPDLPKKLGYVAPFYTDIEPWKHLSAVRPEFYSCVDSDALLRIWNKLVAQIHAQGRWTSFQTEILDCNQRTLQMSKNGIHIDEDLRQGMVGEQATVKERLDIEVQELVPAEIKNVHPPKGYKGVTPEFRCQAGHKMNETCPACQTSFGADPEKVQELGLRRIDVEDLVIEEARQVVRQFTRWAKVEDFNPGSNLQLRRYIEWKHGKGAVPKAKKTGKPTVERDQLERLAKKTGDPVLLLAVEVSEIKTKLSHLNGWAPGEDGCVHTQFTNNPATFRFSAKRPNVQDFPGRTEDYQRMRRMVVPGPGYEWLVARDYASIEPIQVALYADDPDYLRVAERGSHAYLASFMVGEPIDIGMSDDDLAQALDLAKKRTKSTLLPGSEWSYYDAAKRGNNGTNYAMTAGMLHKNAPEAFPTIKHAWATQQLLFSKFPKVYKVWRNQIVDRAYRESRLVNAYGYPRFFWYVKQWKRGAYTKEYQWTAEGGRYFERDDWPWIFSNINKAVKMARVRAPHADNNGWRLDWAEDAKAAIATLPQSSGAIVLRRAILQVPWELYENGSVHLTIHDELVARARNTPHADEISEQLRVAMEQPMPEQMNRVFETVDKRGRNWSQME